MEGLRAELVYLRQTLEELKAQQKDNRFEARSEVAELRKEVQGFNKFLSEVQGGKYLIWGVLTFLAAIGGFLTYFSKHVP